MRKRAFTPGQERTLQEVFALVTRKFLAPDTQQSVQRMGEILQKYTYLKTTALVGETSAKIRALYLQQIDSRDRLVSDTEVVAETLLWGL